jgi:hypothetical protein
LTRNVPSVTATLTMLPDNVRYPNRARYMPHIVLGDPSQREALVGPNNTISEHYLGVLISDAPDELTPGRPIEVVFQLMYWPEERYDGIVSGATFTLREGSKILGFGTIRSQIGLTTFGAPRAGSKYHNPDV